GIDAMTTDGRVLLGNRTLMDGRGIDVEALAPRVRQLAADGKTIVHLAFAGRLLGVLAAADVLKPDAASAVAALKRLGVSVAMLTGDNRLTAEAIARQAGLDRVLAEVLPEDKAREIKAPQAEGRRGRALSDRGRPALADPGGRRDGVLVRLGRHEQSQAQALEAIAWRLTRSAR